MKLSLILSETIIDKLYLFSGQILNLPKFCLYKNKKSTQLNGSVLLFEVTNLGGLIYLLKKKKSP